MRYFYQRFRNRKINRSFRQANPGVKLPPDYLIYESFQINYHKYFTESIDSARWVVAKIRNLLTRESGNILDWGCGRAALSDIFRFCWVRNGLVMGPTTTQKV
jgi:hypothetical protein